LSSAGPRISLLLPARDAALTLAEALSSILAQSFGDFECVLVDDGSRDGTRELARRQAERDRRFVIVEQAAAGLVSALERGLARCRGEFVARMDADDLMHPERLARQLALLEARPELSASGCHIRLFPREQLSQGRIAYEAWLNSVRSDRDVWRERFVECPIAHPSLFIRRAVLVEFGYRDRGWPEDYDLVLRLLAAGHRIGTVPEPLLCWRDRPDRYSRTSPVCAIERFTACKAAFLASSFLASRPDYVLWGYGDTGKSLCRELSSHDKRPLAIVELHPGRIGQRIFGAPVIAPEGIPALGRVPIVVSVAGLRARSEIRAALAELGRRESRDFVCAA
jgi:glycosyltransferase involved in cell wall biosynthesis